jgi:hypothetical protein
MKLDEKDLEFIRELTTAPQQNITLFSILQGSGEKPYYGCILYPSLKIDVTQHYATRQEAADAAQREAQAHGSHPWSILFIASFYFNPVLTALKGPASQPTE